MPRRNFSTRTKGRAVASLAACIMAFALPAAHAQSPVSSDPCDFSNSPECQQIASNRVTISVLVVIIALGGGIGGIVYFGRPRKKPIEYRKAEYSDIVRQQSQAADYEAQNLARVTALAVQANQAMADSTNASVRVHGRVGGVEVTIESSKSVREESEANNLGRLAGPMSHYKEL